MSRIPFSEVLKNASIDIDAEYYRLYVLFYQNCYNNHSIRSLCSEFFTDLPYRGTCISLDDFNTTHGFYYYKTRHTSDIDYLVSFCEYTYNLVMYSINYIVSKYPRGLYSHVQMFIKQVLSVIEKIGYMSNDADEGITDFVPKDQVAISVSEILDPNLSYRVIEYNHHSMKGDLDRKKAIIRALIDKLEPQRKKLNSINKEFASDLGFLANRMNIRHNNVDEGNRKTIASTMSTEQLEAWYDDIYQMCLLAFLELEQLDRKERIRSLKEGI